MDSIYVWVPWRQGVHGCRRDPIPRLLHLWLALVLACAAPGGAIDLVVVLERRFLVEVGDLGALLYTLDLDLLLVAKVGLALAVLVLFARLCRLNASRRSKVEFALGLHIVVFVSPGSRPQVGGAPGIAVVQPACMF